MDTVQAFVLPVTPGSNGRHFLPLRRQVLQHLGRGILIGNTSSLTEVSAEKRGQKPVGAALQAPRRALQLARQFTLEENRVFFWDVDISCLWCSYCYFSSNNEHL